MSKQEEFDFLVIGSGIAGLTFALKVADYGKVVIVTKKEKVETSTNYAQGGVASVLGADDSFDLHIHDTLEAGDGLCDVEVVRKVVMEGPSLIKELVEWGVEFNRSRIDSEAFDLSREGGHSRRRIVHAHDMTGREIERVLLENAGSHPNIVVYENYLALDLILESTVFRAGSTFLRRKIRCFGAQVLDSENNVVQFLAHFTLLCTGGTGKVYLYTSNPDVATGDGIAMAYRAGATLADMEFVQFHPTCLYHPHAKNFLITEAVRGEGGRLIDKAGRAFMKDYHPLKDLACRDVVARAIDTEMKRSGDDCVYLDISHRDSQFLKDRFPNIYEKCISLGIDITREPIPVVPAAHYMCGGIKTDIHGHTDIERLYAIGETACTGLHGANRLASNSLLEALVFANSAAKHILSTLDTVMGENFPHFPAPSVHEEKGSGEMILVAHNWDIIRRLMWNYVGIVRSKRRLSLAKDHLLQVQMEIDEHTPHIGLNKDLIELRNLLTVAQIIIRCALTRKESRGLHYNLDYPHKNDEQWKRHTLVRKEICS